MGNENTQHKLDRTRKPRVQITYDVEKGDASEAKELPFVVGVMSDLSGSNDQEEALKERKFVEVDRDTFNEFLKKQKPRFTANVPNTTTDDADAQLHVDIEFESMKDFEPEGIAEKVPLLKELLETRQRLKSLQSRVSSSDEVKQLVTEAFQDSDRRDELASILGIALDGDAESAPEPAADPAPTTDPEPTSPTEGEPAPSDDEPNREDS